MEKEFPKTEPEACSIKIGFFVNGHLAFIIGMEIS